jgi:tyrosine-protein kinase Etk/Wzc
VKKEKQLLDVTEDHPSIQLLNNELRLLNLNLRAQIDLVSQKNLEIIKQINIEKNIAYGELYNIPDKELVYNRILNENEIRETFLNNMISKRSNYLIAQAGIVSDYIYLQKANLAKDPIAPNRSFIKIIGIILGLLLGVLFIILRYLTHNKIISLSEIESNCNANVLGVIPKYNTEMEHSQIIVTQNPKSSIAESFRAVRTNLDFLKNTEGPKVVTTTSTIPGEGKTFIGINLAAVF